MPQQPTLLPDDLKDLPPGWDYKPLARLVDEARGICYGIVQPGSHTAAGVPIVRVNNIKDGRIDTSDMLRVTQDIESKYRRSRLRGGEVLLTLVGSLGESAVVPPELAGWNVARAVGVLPVTQEIGSRWVELCLRSPAIQHFIRTRATTTVQATFNLRDVATIPIPVPPRNEREAISEVLGSLGEKIELNRRMNETLESAAQALFKSWFVDRVQEDLPPGWQEATVVQEFRLTMGQSPPGDTYNETGEGRLVAVHSRVTPLSASRAFGTGRSQIAT
jgi:type I restriction enzyme S subunit